MFKICMIYIIKLVLVTSTAVSLEVRTTESSEDYLRKVMIELQELKTPITSPTIYSNAKFPAGKRLSGSNYEFLPTPANHKNAPAKTDVMNTAAANPQPYYHQVRDGPNHQLYQYHFYPLRAFMDKLQDNHGYKTLNGLLPHQPVAFPGSNKQIIFNPLFMAVSSFIGMSLLFMFGVLFLPRLFGEFKSRVVHDELLDLTQTVTEAIDNYNSTTMRPKTRFSGAVVGIKTRPVPGVDGATRRRRKTQRPGEKTW